MVTKFKSNSGWFNADDLFFYYVDSFGIPIHSVPYIYQASFEKIVNRTDVGIPWILYNHEIIDNKNIPYMTYIVDTLNIIQEKYTPAYDASDLVKKALQ